MNPLALPPTTDTVILSDTSARPGDAMTFKGNARGEVVDNERALIWSAPNGETIVTIGFIDDHPWSPVHKTTVLLCNADGTPSSPQPQPGSALGIVDHRTAAETWWRLTGPRREKWAHVLETLSHMPVDSEHRPQLPITSELETVLRLTLPWIPRQVWPEWCRRAYTTKAGMLVHGDGQAFEAALGKTAPAAMLE